MTLDELRLKLVLLKAGYTVTIPSGGAETGRGVTQGFAQVMLPLGEVELGDVERVEKEIRKMLGKLAGEILADTAGSAKAAKGA